MDELDSTLQTTTLGRFSEPGTGNTLRLKKIHHTKTLRRMVIDTRTV